jgi:hypothetical protein
MAGLLRTNEMLLIAALRTGKVDVTYREDRRTASGRKAAAWRDSGRLGQIWDSQIVTLSDIK